MSYNQKGKLNNHWKGGSYVDAEGYVLVHTPEHPNAQANGYIRRARLTLSQHLGRPLISFEIAHHKNGDRADDRVENLELRTASQHSKNHRIAKWNKQHPDGELRVCRTCGKVAWTTCDLEDFSFDPKSLHSRQNECKVCCNSRKMREKGKRR